MKTIKQQMENLKNEILKDDISWKEIPTQNPDTMLFDFYDSNKHEKGYLTAQLRIQHDGKEAFISSNICQGYFKSYNELKINQGLKFGEIITKRSMNNTFYIKFY